MSDDLRKAAQDVIDRWHSPKWAHDSVHTGVLIEALRAALAQPAPDYKETLLAIMLKNSLATGHGDTLKQVIDTLEDELTDALAVARRDGARYRFMQHNENVKFWVGLGGLKPDGWAEYIDTAMKGEKHE